MIYDTGNSKIMLSRDVIFHVNKFSYQSTLTSGKVAPLPCISVNDDINIKEFRISH